jgi:hypothetical protein
VLPHEPAAAGGLDQGNQREGQLQRKHHLRNKQVPAAAAAAAAIVSINDLRAGESDSSE